MDSRRGPDNLATMYTFNESNRHIRDPRAHYRAGPPGPEQFPSEIVLRDLRDAARPDAAPLILARYAVLRAWALAVEGAPPPLLEHARAAAAGHLAATPGSWPERALLARLLDGAESGEEASAVLENVAETAEAAGHVDGAFAARTAAWTAALRGLRLATASDVADGMAAFLGRTGAPETAAEWERAASRLRRFAKDWPPPSPS
jgi:hypothetical protein